MAATHTFSGSRLRQLRQARRLTQHDLASALRTSGFGTTQTTISRWEDGQQPQSAVLPSLAAALGVGISDLFGGDDEDEESSGMPLSRDEFALLGDLMGRLGATISIGVKPEAETRR